MIRFSTFKEGETRSFVPSPTMSGAVDAVRNGTADGMTIDDINDSGDYRISWVVMPGRTLDGYFGDECYE